MVGSHFYSVHSKLAQEKLLHKTWKWVNKSHICQGECNNCQSHMHFPAESGGFRHRQSERSICSATYSSRTQEPGQLPQPASPRGPPTTLKFIRKIKISGGNLWPKSQKHQARKSPERRGAHKKAKENLGNNLVFTHSSFQKLCTQQSTFDLKPNSTTTWEGKCKITYVS